MTNLVLLGRNRYRLTSQCLESLYANTDPETFTVCYVDDGSDDFRVTKLLRSYAGKKNFSLLEVSNSGHTLSQLKNLGVAWSEQRWGRGDWLYIGDHDTAFLPGWLEKLTALAANTEPAGYRLWGGQVHPFHQAILPKDGGIHYAGSVFSVDGIKQCEWAEHAVLDGPSWLMRWQVWNMNGPFSRFTAPGACQSEDAEWCARMMALKGRIGVIHPHVVIHVGLSQTDGKDAPGRKEREAMIPKGVWAE